MDILKKTILKTRDILALLVLLLTYHGYEVLCYITSNLFAYYQAVAICAGALFLVSFFLVYFHDWLLRHFSWDALKLQYINRLPEDDNTPSYHLLKKLTRLVLHEGFWAVAVIGPIILGPVVITLLLRRRKAWRTTLAYTLSGSLISALFWVGFMRGLGVFTWGYFSLLPQKIL